MPLAGIGSLIGDSFPFRGIRVPLFGINYPV